MKNFLVKHLFSSTRHWPFEEVLLKWAPGAKLTTGQALEGSICFGASGSGKTSAGIHTEATAMMRAGFGMLFLTTKGTKPSDTESYLAMAREAGRTDSIVQIGPSHALGFNLLRYEMVNARQDDSGDLAANVANIFSTAAELAAPTRDGRTGEHIWRQAVESLVRHAVTAVFSATGDLRLDDIVQVVKSAPQSIAQLSDPAWCRGSFCFTLFERLRSSSERNVSLARDYFLEDFPTFPPDTRNSVLFTFSAGCADLFQREPLHSMFFSHTHYTPDILLDGAVIICDCPVLQYREVGRIANGLIRASAQRALERRSRSRSERPVAIVWDECQKTLLRSDVAFQDTARSARCAVVTATQHIPSLRDAVGTDLTNSFLGNLRTKIFFQNNEPETGSYMERLCADKDVDRISKTVGPDGKQTMSHTPERERALPARASHNLKTGGKENAFKVTGFLVVGSKRQPDGEPYKKTLFDQRQRNAGCWPWSRRVRIVARQRPCPDFIYLTGRTP